MNKLFRNRQNSGITLIALVITIIILIILAGIGINLTVGENGILNRAKQAKGEYLNAQTEEDKLLANLASTISEENVKIPDTKTEEQYDIIFDFDSNDSNKCANKNGTYSLNLGTGKTSVNDYKYLIVFSQCATGDSETSNIIYNFPDAKITKRNDSTSYKYQYCNNVYSNNNFYYCIRYSFNDTTFDIDAIDYNGWNNSKISRIVAFY